MGDEGKGVASSSGEGQQGNEGVQDKEGSGQGLAGLFKIPHLTSPDEEKHVPGGLENL